MYIREFQEMMERIYSHRDFKRGANGTYRWLKEEIEELGEAIQGEDKRIIEDEFADVIAWLASLANVLEIDLEKSAIRKYNDRCPKCRTSPCKCPSEIDAV